MAEHIPKIEVQWWLTGIIDTILREQESGVIDLAVIKEYIRSIMKQVANY